MRISNSSSGITADFFFFFCQTMKKNSYLLWCFTMKSLVEAFLLNSYIRTFYTLMDKTTANGKWGFVKTPFFLNKLNIKLPLALNGMLTKVWSKLQCDYQCHHTNIREYVWDSHKLFLSWWTKLTAALKWILKQTTKMFDWWFPWWQRRKNVTVFECDALSLLWLDTIRPWGWKSKHCAVANKTQISLCTM